MNFFKGTMVYRLAIRDEEIFLQMFALQRFGMFEGYGLNRMTAYNILGTGGYGDA
jgi:hypothetical protein